MVADEHNLPAPRFTLTRRATLKRGGLVLGLTVPAVSALLSSCSDSDGKSDPNAPAKGEKYGGTGVADRAVDAAKALGISGPLTLVAPSGNVGNFEPFYDEWASRTGIKMQSLELPIGQFTDKLFSSATAKTDAWDLIAIQPRLMGDLIGANAIAELTEYVDKHQPDIDDADHGFLPLQREYASRYEGKAYAIPVDGDNWIYAYRKDLLDDADNQAAFKSEYGYDLAPATTWAQYRDIAEFFTGDGVYGAADLVSSGWSFWFWELRYASRAKPQAYYFDDDMNPLVNTPEGIAALEDLINLKDFMPKDIPSWGYTESYAAMGKGEVVQETAWTSLAKYLNSDDSAVKDKWATAPMPGTEIDGEVVSRHIYAYGGSLVVWNYSKASEAAYLFAQWISSPEISGRMTAEAGFADPFRISDMGSEQLAEIYSADVMADYIRVAETSVPEIMIKGSNEYSNVLDENITRAFAGQISAAEAMANVESAWNDITSRLGRDEQKAAWQSLKSTYPQG
ncbi:extracellular solute-binding protein [Nocardioides endophyticus]|uniref:Extracellular solute-binding protein n=1 Tax=Nocardioides endophyticus TaxID=1353775 RepID=A0ABP8YYB2_9ACTN